MSIFQQERVLHKGNCPGSSVWLEGRYVQLAIVEVTTIHWLYILMICPFWMVKNSRFLLQKRTQIPFLSLRTTPAAWYHWPGLNETDDVPQQFWDGKMANYQTKKWWPWITWIHPISICDGHSRIRYLNVDMGCRQDAHPIPNGPPAGYVSFHQSLIVKCMSGKKTTLRWKSHCQFRESNISLYKLSQLYLSFIYGMLGVLVVVYICLII